MIGVLIFLVLLISIPSVIFFNRMASHTGTSRIKSAKALSVAQEGLSYAIHALSASDLTWKNALTGAGSFPTEFGPPAAPTKYNGSSGGQFTIQCFHDTTTMQLYQVKIRVVGQANVAQVNSKMTE